MICKQQQGKPDKHGRVACKVCNRRVVVDGCCPACPEWDEPDETRLAKREVPTLILGTSLIAGIAIGRVTIRLC
jgi:hypothetical protein